ncbi:hypothetical protein [Pseudoxanthomonas japonensis]|uniref:hypothetical protein n=1 Tax=Pseudoxanthomonas japonensis TaxID=69284 RepID=UPI003749A3D7
MPAFYAWLHQGFPDVHLPKLVMFWLHDADIRVRDAEYRRTQDEAIDALIADLERGRLPDRDRQVGCALPLAWLGAGALVALATLWFLLQR